MLIGTTVIRLVKIKSVFNPKKTPINSQQPKFKENLEAQKERITTLKMQVEYSFLQFPLYLRMLMWICHHLYTYNNV